MKYHANQLLLPLTQAVVTERGHSLVCIPDRDSAECELTRIHFEHILAKNVRVESCILHASPLAQTNL